jgi:hypothetical protein
MRFYTLITLKLSDFVPFFAKFAKIGDFGKSEIFKKRAIFHFLSVTNRKSSRKQNFRKIADAIVRKNLLRSKNFLKSCEKCYKRNLIYMARLWGEGARCFFQQNRMSSLRRPEKKKNKEKSAKNAHYSISM